MSALHLRSAQTGDAGRIGAILSAFVDETPWMPRLHSRAEDIAHAGQMIERGWVTVAACDADVAGFLARDGAAVHALYVAQSNRGHGLGSALVQDAQSRSATLRLWTFAANAAARRFYIGHGFTEGQRTDGAGNDEGLPDVEFQWSRV